MTGLDLKKNSPKPLIALLTDFGEVDWFVAAMKGVIKSISPETEIIDVSHNVSSHSISSAAFVLRNSYNFFPEGTIFCVVIDPGVGGVREPIIAINEKYIFVGPNNGVFTLVAQKSKRWNCFEIIERKILPFRTYAKETSQTFQGRDIFAPVAGKISSLKNLSEIKRFSRPLDNFIKIDFITPKILRRGSDPSTILSIEGAIIYIDQFGNLITNIENSLLKQYSGKSVQIICGKKKIAGLSQTFSSVKVGKPVAYYGSAGFLEIAVNQRRADSFFKVAVGGKVTVKILDKRK